MGLIIVSLLILVITQAQTGMHLGNDYHFLSGNKKPARFFPGWDLKGVVRVGGCSGAFVSRWGLILTNYHCIRWFLPDSVLEKGFYANTPKKEIPLRGLHIKIIKEYWEITPCVGDESDSTVECIRQLWGIYLKQPDTSKQFFITQEGHRARVVSLQNGIFHFLEIYDSIGDIRLVFAPSRRLAEFGGEEDNWQWPRHAADFAFVRAYSGNHPFITSVYYRMAGYIPQEGDSVFVVGFPGKTLAYISDSALTVYLRTFILPGFLAIDEIVKAYKRWMDINSRNLPGVYYKHFSSLSNIWKNFKAQIEFGKRKSGKDWEVGLTSPLFRAVFISYLLRAESPGMRLLRKIIEMSETKVAPDSINGVISKEIKLIDTSLEKILIDAAMKTITSAGINMDEHIRITDVLSNLKRGRYRKVIRYIRKSEAVFRYLKTPYLFAGNNQAILDSIILIQKFIEDNSRKGFTSGNLNPDAGGTRRVSPGVVAGLYARDGIYYSPFTTLEGMIEKCSDENPQFMCDSIMIKAYRKNKVRTQIINLLSSAHTSGGNSGSPVFDKNGYVVGVNFDRCYESIPCDFGYSPERCRNIVTSTNFILFVLGEYQAERIISEIMW